MNPTIVEPPICGPDVPPPCIIVEPCEAFGVCAPQPVPTLDTWALIGLLIIICSIAAIKLLRRPWV